MKSKLLIISLIALFFLSTLSGALAATVECPRCHGTGKITIPCQTCIGAGVVKPNITRVRYVSGGNDLFTNVSGVFKNEENFDAYGVATATVETTTGTYTNNSSRTLFPPHQETIVTINITEIGFKKYWSSFISLTEVEDSTCPDCNGTGAGSVVICPDCDGTGYVNESEVGEINFPDVGGPLIGIVAVAVALVTTASFFVLKRKRVTEEKIRFLPFSEFQSWVVQRLSGNVSSVMDSRRGIDGYTGEGSPITIKQSDNVGKNVIDNFATVIGLTKAKSGIIVAFSFDKDAYAAIIRAKINYRIEIKMVTVKELLEGRETTSL
jgi:hypothetical protein